VSELDRDLKGDDVFNPHPSAAHPTSSLPISGEAVRQHAKILIAESPHSRIFRPPSNQINKASHP
jgi:hypothetical protein